MNLHHSTYSNEAEVVTLPTQRQSACLTPNWSGIHPELMALPQWVNWKYERRPGATKCTKVPYQPSGAHASSTDTSTWHSFEECKTAYIQGVAEGKFDGVGFVTSPNDTFVLMDYDHVLPAGLPMCDWARHIVEAAKREGLYVETSVSGEGIHVIGHGPQGFKGRKQNDAELYCNVRFFTITGHSSELPPTIGTARETLELTLQRIGMRLEDLVGAPGIPVSLGSSTAEVPVQLSCASPSAEVDDATILGLARTAKNGEKFMALFDRGDVTAYDGDDSRADLALAAMLAFWIGPDPSRIEALMRSSRLMRDKWNSHRSYLSLTISTALRDMTSSEFYDWTRHGRVGSASNPQLKAMMAQNGSSVPGGGLLTGSKGQVLANVSNAILLLESDPDLQGVIRYNEFADKTEIWKPIPKKTGTPDAAIYPHPWTDADSIALQAYLQMSAIPNISRQDVDAALTHRARDCRYHPVRDYFSSLVWDKTPRLDSWLMEYCNADTSAQAAYLEEVGSKFLISAVARVMRPGCKADHVLVLEGSQGIGKSTALSTLAGAEWFTDSLPNDLGNKDAAIHLRGRLIVEMSELSQFTRSQIETIKAYVTRQTDIYRPPFGRHDIEAPRQCVFAGSTNSDNYLVDSTGNRRFWPVKVGTIDIVALQRDRDQLWAEAYARFRQGEAWHMTDRDVIAIQVEQAASRVVTDPWRADVISILQRHGTAGITPGEVLEQIAGLNSTDRHKGNASRVSAILRELGWRQGKRHHSRGQVYLPPTDFVQLELFDQKPD